MKRIIILLSLLVFCLDVEVLAKTSGKTGATFLKIGLGAKPISMGEAFCAVADDPTTIYYNPAGLALFENRNLSFTHIAWFEDVNYEYLAYINPLQELGIKAQGILACNLAYLGIDDIKEYGNTKDSYLGKFKAHNLLVNLSYARLINQKIGNCGMNLKFINEKIKSSSNAVAFDIGWLHKTNLKNLTLGATMQNITFLSNFKDELPFNIKLGSCYKLLKDNSLTLSLDINLTNDNDLKMYLGAEYLYPDLIKDSEISFRVGYKTGVDNGKIGFGFGVKYDKYKLDYAYSSYNDLGNIHQLSFNMRFDKITSPLTTNESKIKDVLSHSTSLGSESSNVDFEPKETKSIEFEDTTQNLEKTQQPITQNKLEDKPTQPKLEPVASQVEKEKEPIIKEVDEEDKLAQIRKKIEEEMQMRLGKQETKAEALEEALNFLKTEFEEDTSAKAKVSIGGKK